MEQNENENQRLLKIALVAGIVGYGIARHKKLLALGLIVYFSGVMKNFQIKEFIQSLTDNFTIAEVNNLPVDDNDDSGGNRTGSPAGRPVTGHAV